MVILLEKDFYRFFTVIFKGSRFHCDGTWELIMCGICKIALISNPRRSLPPLIRFGHGAMTHVVKC